MTFPSLRRCAAWLIAIGLFVRAVSSQAGDSFPKPGAVVILTGIAGDAETEKSYEDTLAQLLAFLENSSSKPEQVFLLSDLKVASAPGSLPIKRMDSTRKDFLGLSQEVKGKALTVFAWGHAGTQGKTPVFHVRGPRLTPDDFATLAAGTGEASDWVLMFVGSSDFARVLQGEGRRLLTSENKTRFSSDPIGMNLLVRAFSSAADLASAGKALGMATEKYYEDRHLVRVEEPTLWDGKTDPQQLATSTSVEPPSTTPAPVRDNAGNRNWTTLPRVKAEDFPAEDGVILQRRITYVLGEAVASMEEREEVIQILTTEGKQLGDFDVSFSPPEENLEFIACEVLGTDGQIQKVDPDSIREVNQKAWADYAMPSRKIFSMPNVTPGALLHVHFRRSWKHYPLPFLSFEIELGGAAPALATTVEVRLSDKSAFHFTTRGIDGIDPKIETRNYSQIYRWNIGRTDASRHEPLTPPNSEPALLISTFPDWQSFSSWYRRLIKLADEPTPELTAKAKELTEDLKSPLEKARAIYEFVTSLRYVAVPMGVNSHRPHAAGNVFSNRFGDCKDKANLYNTMLRTIGIEADLVLVPRFDQAYDATPGLAFNHAISRLKVGGKTIWADTTDDVCRFGLLPPGDPGRNVLVIDEATHSLTPLPQGGPSDHSLSIDQDIDLSGERPSAELKATPTGFFDYAFRSAARGTNATRTSFPVADGVLKRQAGEFRLRKQSFTPVSALDQPFEWQASGDYSRLTTRLPGTSDRLLTAPLLFPGEWMAAGYPRTRPLLLNQGYPGTLDQRISYRLPAGAGEIRLPEPASGQSSLLKWSIDWKRSDNSRVELHCAVTWPKAELTAGEAAQFQQELDKLQSAAAVPAILQGR